MPRPPGSRNPDFERTRAELLSRVQRRLAQPDGVRASFRDLAVAAGASTSTLRHYFGSREGLIASLMEHWHALGQRYLFAVATEPLGPVRDSLRSVLDRIAIGFRAGGLAQVHTIGLSVGFGDPTLGPAYLTQVFDPTIVALEARISRHVARGDLRAADARVMALEFAAAPLFALLHQGPLGGHKTRPLDLEAFFDAHVDAFLASYGAPTEVDRTSRTRDDAGGARTKRRRRARS